MTTTTSPAHRHPRGHGRRLIAALSTLTLPVVLSGCAVFSPMATENMYNPGDGTNLDLGHVEIRDLLVVGSGEDEPATIVGYAVNNSTEPATLEISAAGGNATIELEPLTGTQISSPGEPGATLDSLGVGVGAMVPLQVQVDDNPPATVNAPSVSAENDLYAEYAG